MLHRGNCGGHKYAVSDQLLTSPVGRCTRATYTCISAARVEYRLDSCLVAASMQVGRMAHRADRHNAAKHYTVQMCAHEHEHTENTAETQQKGCMREVLDGGQTNPEPGSNTPPWSGLHLALMN